MRILVLHNKIKPGSYADFLFQLLIQSLTDRNYLIIETKSFSESKKVNIQKENAVVLFDLNKIKLPLLSTFRLRSLIKKQQIEWLVQVTDGEMIRSHLPQLVFTNHIEKLISKSVPSSLSLAVCSAFAKQKIIESHNLKDANLKIIPGAADEVFQPISWSDQQSVKMQFTQGREYFLVTAESKTMDSFTALLKAFSAFKKWQHSSMKLVVSGKLFFTQTSDWNEKISTYKYRDDVVILEELNDKEQIALLAGAYAFVHTPMQDNDVVALLQAMQCGTLCISFLTDSIKEYADDAAILTEQNNYEQLAEKMILIYKDETLRSRLIERGKQQAQHYTKEKALSCLLNALPANLH